MGYIYSVQYQEDISSRKVCWQKIFWWYRLTSSPLIYFLSAIILQQVPVFLSLFPCPVYVFIVIFLLLPSSSLVTSVVVWLFTWDWIQDSPSLQPSHKPDRWTAGSPVLVLLPLMSPSWPWGLSFLELSGLRRDVASTAVLSELFVFRRTKLKASYSNNCWPRSAIYDQSLTWFLNLKKKNYCLLQCAMLDLVLVFWTK